MVQLMSQVSFRFSLYTPHIDLQTSDVALTYHLWLSYDGQATIAVANPHRLWIVQRLADIRQGFPASSFAYTSWSSNVRHYMPTLPLASIKLLDYVRYGLPTLLLACTQRLADIRCGLPSSSQPCTECIINVERGASSGTFLHRCVNMESGLKTSFITCTHWSFDVRCGLPALYAAYKYLSTNVDQWRRSNKASIHLTWHVHILKMTSTNGMQPQQRSAHTDMECAYLEGNVGQCHATSTKYTCKCVACVHLESNINK